jgi:hypothetical protein
VRWVHGDAVSVMEVWPSATALQEEVANRHVRRRLRAGVVSDVERRGSDRVRCGS